QAVRADRADLAIMGRFANLGQQIGITITLDPVGKDGSEITGVIPATGEILAVSAEPIPSFKGAVATAGAGGVTTPKCGKCPHPEPTKEAKRKHISGEITLEVLVSPEGSIVQVAVVRGLGYGLDENAVEVVKTWKLKPAADWAGRAVTVKMPI